MVTLLALPSAYHRGERYSTAPARLPTVTINKRQGQLSCSHAFEADSPTPKPPKPVPLCCPVQLWGPLTQVLQPVSGWASSPVLHSHPLEVGSFMCLPSGPAPLCCLVACSPISERLGQHSSFYNLGAIVDFQGVETSFLQARHLLHGK